MCVADPTSAERFIRNWLAQSGWVLPAPCLLDEAGCFRPSWGCLCSFGDRLKVRITHTPRERELDGVRLDGLKRGMVRDGSPSIGSWLVAHEYALPVMRSDSQDKEKQFSSSK